MATRIVTEEAHWSPASTGTSQPLVVQEDGTVLPARTILNFGAGLVATDNPTLGRTDVVATAPTGGGDGGGGGGTTEPAPDPFETPLSEGNAAVGTTSTLAKAANADRSLLVLTNGSDTGMWITFASSGATIGTGTYLPAQSSPLVLPYSGAVSAVHVGVSGTKLLGVTEF
jgi:hypothetical protein